MIVGILLFLIFIGVSMIATSVSEIYVFLVKWKEEIEEKMLCEKH